MSTNNLRIRESRGRKVVVPLVGGFLLDFRNAVVITVSLNLIG